MFLSCTPELRTDLTDNEEQGSSSDLISSENSDSDWPISVKRFLRILNAEKVNAELNATQKTRVKNKPLTCNDSDKDSTDKTGVAETSSSAAKKVGATVGRRQGIRQVPSSPIMMCTESDDDQPSGCTERVGVKVPCCDRALWNGSGDFQTSSKKPVGCIIGCPKTHAPCPRAHNSSRAISTNTRKKPPGVVKRSSFPSTFAAGIGGRGAAGCSEKHFPMLPLKTAAADKPRVDAPRRSAPPIRPEPSAMGKKSDGKLSQCTERVAVEKPCHRALWNGSSDSRISTLSKKPVRCIGSSQMRAPSPREQLNSRATSNSTNTSRKQPVIVKRPSPREKLSSRAISDSTNTSRKQPVVVKKASFPSTFSACTFSGSAGCLGRRLTRLPVLSKTSVAGKSRCCSRASSDGLCDVGKRIVAAVRPALYRDKKQLIRDAYTEPKTTKVVPTRSGHQHQTSASINRKAKHQETLRLNCILKNRLLKVKPTISRIKGHLT